MQHSTYTTRIIAPDNGCWLTQAEDVEPIQRIFTDDKIFLGVGDEPENWREISQEEYEILSAEKMAAEEALREAEEANHRLHEENPSPEIPGADMPEMPEISQTEEEPEEPAPEDSPFIN